MANSENADALARFCLANHAQRLAAFLARAVAAPLAPRATDQSHDLALVGIGAIVAAIMLSSSGWAVTTSRSAFINRALGVSTAWVLTSWAGIAAGGPDKSKVIVTSQRFGMEWFIFSITSVPPSGLSEIVPASRLGNKYPQSADSFDACRGFLRLLRNEPKPKIDLANMCVAGEYILDAEILHDHHAREINERNVGLVAILEPPSTGQLEMLW